MTIGKFFKRFHRKSNRAPLIRHFASQEKELAELDDQAVLLPSLALIVKRLRDMKALQLGTLNERQVKFLRALAKYKAP